MKKLISFPDCYKISCMSPQIYDSTEHLIGMQKYYSLSCLQNNNNCQRKHQQRLIFFLFSSLKISKK